MEHLGANKLPYTTRNPRVMTACQDFSDAAFQNSLNGLMYFYKRIIKKPWKVMMKVIA
jgi:hypothetical protein